MGKWKKTHTERNKNTIKYYKSIAVSIDRIIQSSNNQDFRKKCETLLNINNIGEVKNRLIQLMTQNNNDKK